MSCGKCCLGLTALRPLINEMIPQGILGSAFFTNLAAKLVSYQIIGALLALCIFIALLAVLVLCPALLRVLYKNR